MLKSFVAGVVIAVLTDERTEELFARLITKYVAPLIPAAVGAAVDQAAEHLTDLDRDGKPDAVQVVEAAKSVVNTVLPDWLRLPG